MWKLSIDYRWLYSVDSFIYKLDLCITLVAQVAMLNQGLTNIDSMESFQDKYL